VHLENQIGMRRHELRHAVGPAVGGAAGRIYEQHIAIGGVGFMFEMPIG
jgi:hypothetical protein